MKKFIISLSMFMSFSMISHATTVECHFSAGGYDDETLLATLQGNKVISLAYFSYQGEVGPFRKQQGQTFLYSTEDLQVNYTASFVSDLKHAILEVTYKEDGSLLSHQVFDCR